MGRQIVQVEYALQHDYQDEAGKSLADFMRMEKERFADWDARAARDESRFLAKD